MKKGGIFSKSKARGMERELIKKLIAVESEIESRKGKLYNYNREKVHEKQMAFHKCLKANRWVFGGNRSGKTECGAVESVWLARGIHPYRQNRKNVFGSARRCAKENSFVSAPVRHSGRGYAFGQKR